MEIVPQHENVGSLVPLEPTRDYAAEARDQAQKMSVEDDLHKYFIDLISKHEKLFETEWSHIKKQWVKARNYFDGRQYGYVTTTNQWVDYQKQPGEVNHTDNVYQPHIQTAMMELSRGSTELNFSHIAKDSYYGELIKQVAESRYQTHKRRLFSRSKIDQENLSLLFNGIAARYTFFRWDGCTKTPSFGNKTGDEMSATVCANCGVPVKGESCPRCGSEDTTEEKVGFNATVIESYEDTPEGENDWVSVDPLGLTFLLTATSIQETPYWIWRQSILRDVLQAKYPDINIVADSKSDDKISTDIATPNVQFGLTQGKESNADLVQAWFDVDVYGNYELKKSTILRNGRVIQAGTKLRDAFPSGLYLCANGKTILDVWDEDKNEKWTACPYVTRMGTLVGAGTTGALDAQDRLNDLLNLQFASVMNDAFRKEFVNSTYIDPDQIPSDPRERAVISNLPPGTNIIGGVIDALPPSTLSSDAYALPEKAAASMQNLMGTFSGGAIGMPDLQAVKNTATAYLAYRNTMVGRFAPMLAVRADALDKEQAYQLLENDQKYLTPEQWDEIKGDYGADAVKAFLNCDLREELVIEVVGESYMPQGQQDRQAKVMAGTQALADAQVDPNSEAAAYIADAFDLPTHLIGGSAIKDMAMSNIAKFKMVADMIVQSLGDIPSADLVQPKTAQIAHLVVSQAGVEVSPSMENHQAVIEALKDWWVTDQGRGASNVLKASVTFFEQLHEMAIAQDAQDKQKLAMMAQPPQPQAPPEPPMRYAEAPPDIKRQMEEQAGFQPSQMESPDEAKARQEDERTKADILKTAVDAAKSDQPKEMTVSQRQAA